MTPVDISRVKAAIDYALHRSPKMPKRLRGSGIKHGMRLDRAGQNFRTANSASMRWLDAKIIKWRKAGRLAADGRLKVDAAADQRWTFSRVRAAAPEANDWDRIAVLIELDGVIEEKFMSDPLSNIREVVGGIAKEELVRELQDPARGEAVRALVRDEVGVMFAELLGTIKRAAAPPPADTPARQNKCGRCGVLGHRKKTCTARGPIADDKWACLHCANLRGSIDAASVTHPIPPAEFHKDDPSYKPA